MADWDDVEAWADDRLDAADNLKKQRREDPDPEPVSMFQIVRQLEADFAEALVDHLEPTFWQDDEGRLSTTAKKIVRVCAEQIAARVFIAQAKKDGRI